MKNTIQAKNEKIKQIFRQHFLYHNPSSLIEDLDDGNNIRDDLTASIINNALIELRKDINRKEILENKTSEKTVDIIENILMFNNQQKDKGRPSDLANIACVAKIYDRLRIKILTPKQTLQRLRIALA